MAITPRLTYIDTYWRIEGGQEMLLVLKVIVREYAGAQFAQAMTHAGAVIAKAKQEAP